MESSHGNRVFRPFILLSLFVAVGVVLRIHGMGRESLWWDEYTSHVYLNASSLLEFLKLNRTLDPLTLPFYYIFEYLWHHYVSGSVYGLRLMSVALGAATIPLLYGLGKRMTGERAGWLAAALLTVSPVHIHHSQGIRMYVVFVLLAAATLWTFLQLLDRPSLRQWLAHGLVSLCLYWTHPFAGLVPAVLGTFLLLHYSTRRALFFRWTLLQLILYVPTAIYLSSVRFWPTQSTHEWIQYPSAQALLADIFWDDISAFHWQFHLGDLAQSLGNLRWGVDLASAVLILLMLVYLVRTTFGSGAENTQVHRQRNVLLLIWIILPPSLLFLVSWLVRPCMFPRYTVHCMPALYLCLGGSLAAIQSKRFAWVLGLALVGALFLQWVWLQPGPQRTDWRSAGRFIHEQAGPEDAVFVESFLWRNVFTHNVLHMTSGPFDIPVAASERAPVLAAQAALWLGINGNLPTSSRAPHAWAVVGMDYFDPGVPVPFERHLSYWGIPFERTPFPSIRKLYVYRLEAPQPNTLPETVDQLYERWAAMDAVPSLTDSAWSHEFMQALGDLATQLAVSGRPAQALKIFEGVCNAHAAAREIYGNLILAIEHSSDFSGQLAAVNSLWDAWGFRANNDPVRTIRSLEKAAAFDSQHLLVHFELGYELTKSKRYPEAYAAFSQVVALDPSFHDRLLNMRNALQQGSPEEITQKMNAVIEYRAGLLAQSQCRYDDAVSALDRAIASDPALDDAHTSRVFILIIQRRFEAAYEGIQRYLRLVSSPKPGAYGLLTLIHLARGNEAAALETLNIALQDDAYRRQFGEFFNAFLVDRDYAKTAAAMHALKTQGIDLFPIAHDLIREYLNISSPDAVH